MWQSHCGVNHKAIGEMSKQLNFYTLYGLLMVEDITRLPWLKNVMFIAKKLVEFVIAKPKVLIMYHAYNNSEIMKHFQT
jgi:hypothetical protein